MWFSSWLPNRIAKRPAERRAPNRRPARFRPRLESLDARDVPSTFTVTNSLYDGSPGSLRWAVGQANANAGDDTITFDATAFQTPQTITLAEGELQITENLTIQGPGAGVLTISGGGLSGRIYGSRVFEIDGAATAVNLSGLSITGGTGLHYTYDTGTGIGWGGGGQTGGSGTAADGQGGAIWNGGVLTVSGCTLTGNSVDADPTYSISPYYGFSGGAVYNTGTLTVTNSTVSKNLAGDVYWSSGGSSGRGGAIFNSGALTVVNSALSDNTAFGSSNAVTFSSPGVGGAIDNFGSLSMTGCTLSGNTAHLGGAVANGYKTSAVLTGVTLASNTAYDGGAVWTNGTMALSGCSVDGNTASDAGGGIYNAKEGHLTIQSKSTVTGNSAPAGSDLDSFGSVKISKDSTIG
jgi:hypothetical protein